MESYFYVASLAPGGAVLIFLLIELARKKLFFRAIRKVCIMTLIIFFFTIASSSVAVFITSAENRNSSDNPGIGIIFLPVLNGIIVGSFIILLFIALKLIAKCVMLRR